MTWDMGQGQALGPLQVSTEAHRQERSMGARRGEVQATLAVPHQAGALQWGPQWEVPDQWEVPPQQMLSQQPHRQQFSNQTFTLGALQETVRATTSSILWIPLWGHLGHYLSEIGGWVSHPATDQHQTAPQLEV